MSLTEVMFKEHQKLDLLFSTFYDSFKYETRYEIEIIVLSTNRLLISIVETMVQGYMCIFHALKHIIHTKTFMV